MASLTVIEQLKSVDFSAVELREAHPEWSDATIEEWLNFLNNFVKIAELLQVEVNQKLEEVPTDFSDGSVPFVDDGFLLEDNLKLFWNNITDWFYAENILTGELIADTVEADTGTFDGVIYTDTPTTPGQKGLVTWNDTEKTIDVNTGWGPVIQVGHEEFLLVHNATGGTLDNGTVVYPVGQVGGNPSVAKSNASTFEKIERGVSILTMDIPNGETGLSTILGRVRGIDTSGVAVGFPAYVGLTDGEFTGTKPSFPNYPIIIGGVTVSDAVNGELLVTPTGQATDTFNNAWNGVFRESFDFRVTSDGAIITGTLTPSNGHPDMTMLFSDGFSLLDTSTVPLTITLTAGTVAIPVTNYVYIPQSTKVLTVSTSAWPATVEHIRVAQVFLQTAVATQENGSLRNQNWNDHIQDTTTNQGHQSHLGQKLRQFEAQWDSGAEGSVVINAGVVSVKSTSGSIFQMHPQVWQAQDMLQYAIDAVGANTFTHNGADITGTFTTGKIMSVNGSTGNDGIYTVVSSVFGVNTVITVSETLPSAVADGTMGDEIYVVNSDSGAYTLLTDLAIETNDASGGTLANSSFSVVIWGSANKTGEPAHLFANMPLGTYNRLAPDLAIQDAQGYSVYTIPKAFQGTGFLIARFTFQVTAGSLWSSAADGYQDLRGFLPNTTAGAGAGGSGVTSYLGLTDTDSTYVGQATKIPTVNAGETALEFQDSIALAGTISTDSLNVEVMIGDIAVSDAAVKVDSSIGDLRYSILSNTVYNGADDAAGMSMGIAFAPTSATTKNLAGIGGFATIANSTTNIRGSKGTHGFRAGVNGLSFSLFNGTGETIVDGAGIAVAGAISSNNRLTATNLWGLYVLPWNNGFNGNATITNLYGIEIRNADAPTAGVTGTNQFGLSIDKPTRATTNYQEVLNGTGSGSGIWFGGTSGIRVYPKTTAILAIDKILETDGGRIKPPVVTTNATFQIVTTDYEVFCDSTAGNLAPKLPTPVDGQTFRIVNIAAANNVAVWTVGYGALVVTLTPGQEKILTYSSGAATPGWY